MSQNKRHQKAKNFVRDQFQKGLHVYLFEVADFFPEKKLLAFGYARRVMQELINNKEAVEATLEADRPRYEPGPSFYRIPGR